MRGLGSYKHRGAQVPLGHPGRERAGSSGQKTRASGGQLSVSSALLSWPQCRKAFPTGSTSGFPETTVLDLGSCRDLRHGGEIPVFNGSHGIFGEFVVESRSLVLMFVSQVPQRCSQKTGKKQTALLASTGGTFSGVRTSSLFDVA